MTKLEIWNAALAALPHDRRVYDEEEESLEAQLCSEVWNPSRKAVLSSREWGAFVRSMPAYCGVRPGGGFFVVRPREAMVVVGLFDRLGQRLEAEALDGGFRLREPAAEIRYIEDEPDPEFWSNAIIDAVVAEMAARLALVMTDNQQRAIALRQEAMARLEEAARVDAQETAWSGGDPYVFANARR